MSSHPGSKRVERRGFARRLCGFQSALCVQRASHPFALALRVVSRGCHARWAVPDRAGRRREGGMLSVGVIGGSGGDGRSAGYYTASVARGRDDYYTGKGEAPGE